PPPALWLGFRHNTHRLVLFVLLCLQQVERVITVSTKTCYDKYIYFHAACCTAMPTYLPIQKMHYKRKLVSTLQ
ncbi:hypothetical protein L9F63_005447, partial [Diploptera punctata]